jgi:hypothetical protein
VTASVASASVDAQPSRARSLHDLLVVRRLWLALWPLGLAAELLVLAPLVFGDEPVTATAVVYRIIGGSFIASGLIAWQRRPENRVGALMVLVGFAFFINPLLSQVDASPVQTLGSLLTDLWTIPFVVCSSSFRMDGRSEQGSTASWSPPSSSRS